MSRRRRVLRRYEEESFLGDDDSSIEDDTELGGGGAASPGISHMVEEGVQGVGRVGVRRPHTTMTLALYVLVENMRSRMYRLFVAAFYRR